MVSIRKNSRKKIIINIVGDSGDGIQLIGTQLSNSAAWHNLDVNTLPNFPAEIRAPAGTLAGVSSYQLQFSEDRNLTAGDEVDVLFAMNPAALKIGMKTVTESSLIIVNQDSFTTYELNKAGYTDNPLSHELSAKSLIQIPLSRLTQSALKEFNLPASQINKSKNMFALGILTWLFTFEITFFENWIKHKFKKNNQILEANLLTLQKGYHYAEISELFQEKYCINSSLTANSRYCQISGNEAFAFACLVAAMKSVKPFLLAGYPITPASSLLQTLSHYTNTSLKVFQAEDEIAALGAVIGASYGGSFAVAVTSGPGMDLKTEFLGLAVITELPLVVLNIQRAGPSTGMPTKPEQSDLLAAIYGRHGECPIPVLAPCSPGDCYSILLDAFHISTKYMTPVIVLSDAHLANATERWSIPEYAEVKLNSAIFAQEQNYLPYQRDPESLVRFRAIPGMKGFEHRIGGLEKENGTGQVSYDGDNHQTMTLIRQEKINRIAYESSLSSFQDFDFLTSHNENVLVLSWGSTFGAVRAAITQLRKENRLVAHLHLRLIYPLPNQLKSIICRFKKIIIPELNAGQLSKLIREHYLIKVISFNKIKGQQFLIDEIYQYVEHHVSETN